MNRLHNLKRLLKRIIGSLKSVLQENLVGVYLHGSLATGCFNPRVSDIDFLVVVKKLLALTTKRKIVDFMIDYAKAGPKRGLEMSIVLLKTTKNFTYPTPYELHYSRTWEEKYLSAKRGLSKMNREDYDLAAHFTMINKRGKKLYGKSIKDVFSPIPTKYYLASLMADEKYVSKRILKYPVYGVLNLCRILYFVEKGICASKKEGATWFLGLKDIENAYREIVKTAFYIYTHDESRPTDWNKYQLKQFLNYMEARIKEKQVLTSSRR